MKVLYLWIKKKVRLGLNERDLFYFIMIYIREWGE